MLRNILIFLLVKCVCCGFFDLTDVDDSFAFLPSQSWGSRVPNLKLTECRTQTGSGIKFGVCTPHSNCLLSRGRPNGFCGLFSTCCVFENTCGKTSNTKVTYFEGTDIDPTLTSCSYKIKLQNSNVCQIRLDFVKFNLAPATKITAVSSSSPYPIYKCSDDVMTIQPNHYNIPDLCGNNDKQHVYIHVNQSDGVTKGVQLDIALSNRELNTHLQAPSWKIKVTQLECPGKLRGINSHSDEIIQDFPLLAPLGAIQYFTDTTGYIKSFGFDGSVPEQSYTYDQKYAMAFKREINICGIKFSPDYINLPRDALGLTDINCKHYLYVPDLHFDEANTVYSFVSKVCLNTPDVFRSYAPGPLYVHFNSLDTSFETVGTEQQGFNIKYELLNKCS